MEQLQSVLYNDIALPKETGSQATEKQQIQVVYKKPSPKQKLYLPFKRFIDITLSLLAIILCAPLFCLVALLIKIDSSGSVFFKQKRVGKNGKEFTVYKFRSMKQNAEEQLFEMDEYTQHNAQDIKQRLKDDPRITRVGKYIRKTSIDELPQLINILKGDMSVVGPRPLATYEHEELDNFQQQRAIVKPGLTCFWQVSGRSLLDEKTRTELDIKYVHSFNFFTDVKLIAKTVPVVVTGKGAY